MFLENAKRVALADMAYSTNGQQQVIGSRASARLVGFGFAVAKGWATYAGNGEFKITDAGREALRQINNPE